MTKRLLNIVVLLVFICFQKASAQVDTLKQPIQVDSLMEVSATIKNKQKLDSIQKAFSPKKATIRSAIIPGWGQAYNKKYWKIPIIYGALGVTGYIFFYNLDTYKDLRFAYTAKYEAALPKFDPQSPYPGPFRDSTKYRMMKAEFVPIDINSLRSYRDEFRRNVDYSVLFFLLFWGLNVVDATVDAHLKTFNVSPDLSLRFKLGPSQMAGTTGASLVLAFK